jgi:hypothetical protein
MTPQQLKNTALSYNIFIQFSDITVLLQVMQVVEVLIQVFIL